MGKLLYSSSTNRGWLAIVFWVLRLGVVACWLRLILDVVLSKSNPFFDYLPSFTENGGAKTGIMIDEIMLSRGGPRLAAP